MLKKTSIFNGKSFVLKTIYNNIFSLNIIIGLKAILNYSKLENKSRIFDLFYKILNKFLYVINNKP